MSANRASRMVALAWQAQNGENKIQSEPITPKKDREIASRCPTEESNTIKVPRTFIHEQVVEPIVTCESATVCSLYEADHLNKAIPCSSGTQKKRPYDMPIITSDSEMEESCDDSLDDPNFKPNDSSSSSENDLDSGNENMQIHDIPTVLEIISSTIKTPQTIPDLVVESKETPKLRKAKRNSGKSYTTLTGKFVKAKEIKLLHSCKRNCSNKLSPEHQEQIFTQYWDMGNFNLRMAFVAGLIDIQDKKRTSNIKSTTAPRNRQFSYCYYLNIAGIRTQVCQKCFKSTLGETDRFLKTVISKKVESLGTTISQDLRGKGPSAKKISEGKYKEVVDHIKTFSAYESHYSRSHTSKLYLNSYLSLSKMYRLYVQDKIQPVSLSKYAEIFHIFGLKFKKPQLDTCTKCDLLKIKIMAAESIELQNLIKEQTTHHEMADQAYESKKTDIAAISTSSKVFAFDLQQCLPTPYLRSSICFYKRQLYTFNLTIHDCGTATAARVKIETRT